jgi:outer membrane protein assembly factor BamD
MLQAEAEYRDFITFFPTLPEAGEAQMRVAMIHYRAMEKPDRDPNHAQRAEQEFQKLLLTYPNGPFVPLAEQRLREVQEVLAEGSFQVGRFYYLEGADYAAQPRLKELVARYPNYSRADTALYFLARSLERFGSQGSSADAIAYYSRLVRDYPLSEHLEDSKERLVALNAPIPDPDPVAVARMTYEQAQVGEVGFWGRLMGGFHRHPNVAPAQGRIGTPTMTVQGPAQAGALPASSQNGSPSPTSPASSGSATPAIVMEPVPAPNPPGNSNAP